jgi:Lon protease-like protein
VSAYDRSVFEADDVDYSQPVALFPLPTVSLFPHALQALHVFEPRYRQMVEDAAGDGGLESAAPIAMATFGARDWRDDYGGTPPLRPVVCVGRLVRHQRRPDGRHDIVLHGVARARILAMHEPDGRRLYRMAEVVPLERPRAARPPMPAVRAALHELLSRPRLARVEAARQVLECFGEREVPTHAAVEVAGYALVRDAEARYRLLAEADPRRRAELVRDAIAELERLVALAERQGSEEWPKGESWN